MSSPEEIGAHVLLSAALYEARGSFTVSREALAMVQMLRDQQIDFGYQVQETEDGYALVLSPAGGPGLLDDYRAMMSSRNADAGQSGPAGLDQPSTVDVTDVSMPRDPEFEEDEEEERKHEEANYMSYLMEAERSGESAPVKIGPYTAMIMIGAFQLATRHPMMAGVPVKVLRSMVDSFKPWFEGTPGERMILRGEHPEWDED